jgi:outer membrane receptor for Fe3+-dicitrate
MNNARRRRESREYVAVIMRAARSTKLEFEEHQIMFMYNNLDLEFQLNILMLFLSIKLSNFLQSLDDKKDIWWNLINRQLFRFDNTRTRNSYNNFYNEQFRTYFQSEQQSFDQYDFQNESQRISQWSSINFYRFSYQSEWAN